MTQSEKELLAAFEEIFTEFKARGIPTWAYKKGKAILASYKERTNTIKVL